MQKPDNVNQDAWDAFIEWVQASPTGIGDSPDDWMPWFECWYDGYESGKYHERNGQ